MPLRRAVLALLASGSILCAFDAAALVQAGQASIFIEGSEVVDVEVVEGFAYVLDAGATSPRGEPFSSFLLVFDVSNPVSPLEVGRLETLRAPRDLEVVDGFAYVADGTARGGLLRVIDVSEASAPVEIAGFGTTSPAFGVDVVNALAFVATFPVWILDVSNPAQPAPVGAIDLPAVDVAVVDARAYLLDAGFHNVNGTLRIFDVSNPATPVELSALALALEFPIELEVVGALAYVWMARS
jgi:hypothetical protein